MMESNDEPSPSSSNRTIPTQVADLPLEGSAQNIIQVPGPQTNSRRRNRLKLCGFITLIVVSLALIIGLSVGLTRDNDKELSLVSGESPISAPTPAPVQPTPAPTASAAEIAAVKTYILNQGYATPETINEDTSPQSRTAVFMANSPLEIPVSETSPEGGKWLDRFVMALFYYSMDGPSWSIRLNFNVESLDTCDWNTFVRFPSGDVIPSGCFCNDDGRVNQIRAIANGLTGEIPPELSLLTTMEALNLQENQGITGDVPDLSSWSDLKYLLCVDCNLSGSLPAWIGSASELLTLGLTNNMLTGAIPTNFGNLKNLELLALDDNSLTGSLSVLEGCTALKIAYLEINDFGGTIDSSFMSTLTSLEQLDVSDNNLVGQVPTTLMSHENITVLDVHGNQLTSFPDSIPVNSPLDFLTVHENPIVGPFPNTISNLIVLHHLDVSSTSFTGTMPTVLAQLPDLTYLFMADTVFDVGTIPDEYSAFSGLVDFSLKDSGRTGTIPTWLGIMTGMALLDLDSNELMGTIPSELANMPYLSFLILNRNRLIGTVPTELQNLSFLQILLADNNSLNGSFPALLCNAQMKLLYTADCGGMAPEVTCNSACCVCCEDILPTACEDHENLDYLAQYDPTWWTGYNRNYQYSFQDFNITEPQQ